MLPGSTSASAGSTVIMASGRVSTGSRQDSRPPVAAQTTATNPPLVAVGTRRVSPALVRTVECTVADPSAPSSVSRSTCTLPPRVRPASGSSSGSPEPARMPPTNQRSPDRRASTASFPGVPLSSRTSSQVAGMFRRNGSALGSSSYPSGLSEMCCQPDSYATAIAACCALDVLSLSREKTTGVKSMDPSTLRVNGTIRLRSGLMPFSMPRTAS